VPEGMASLSVKLVVQWSCADEKDDVTTFHNAEAHVLLCCDHSDSVSHLIHYFNKNKDFLVYCLFDAAVLLSWQPVISLVSGYKRKNQNKLGFVCSRC